ncbi:hypothetical protein D3C73_1450420 [compost metagenome]
MIGLDDTRDINIAVLTTVRSLDEVPVVIDSNITNMSKRNTILEFMDHSDNVII